MTKKSQVGAGNQLATKHGAEGAIKRLQRGQPFIGLAREVLDGVLAEMGVDLGALSGVEGILVKRAARFEACARMFDHAADNAALEGDLARWERYQQRSGWIGGRAFGALKEVKAVLAEKTDGVLLDAIKEAGDD